MWTPDVYEGAPTPVTTFFASAPKMAAMAILVRVAIVAFPGISADWREIVTFISIASMALGSFAAIGQTNIKRLMAYSSIGHMGFALVGLAAGTVEGAHGVIVYMAIYLAMTLGTFAGILSMRRDGAYVEDIADLAGLARTNAPMAFFLAAMMFSLAGVPPLAGFFAKFYVFAAAMKADLYGLAVIGVLLSAVGAYYYLRIVKIMYFDEPAKAFDQPGAAARIVLALSTALVIFYAFAPGAADRRGDGRGEVAVLNAIDSQIDDPEPLFAGWRVARFARARLDQRRSAPLARSPAIPGRLWIVADEQTHGRGRKGRFWSSPPGNLYASALLVDPCPPALAPQIGFVAGVALRPGGRGSRRRRRRRSNGRTTSLWRGAKIAGLLVEGVTTPDRRLACIVGIGVNCVSAPEGLAYPAADSATRSRRAVSAEALFVRLATRFHEALGLWARGAGFAAIRARMARHRRRGSAGRSASPIRAARAKALSGARRAAGGCCCARPAGVETIEAADLYLGADGRTP